MDTASPEMNDEELEKLLLSRIDGPFVDVDRADFVQMRAKLRTELDFDRREPKR